jgi:hypothetical protein
MTFVPSAIPSHHAQEMLCTLAHQCKEDSGTVVGYIKTRGAIYMLTSSFESPLELSNMSLV